jgi:hypothetical protein
MNAIQEKVVLRSQRSRAMPISKRRRLWARYLAGRPPSLVVEEVRSLGRTRHPDMLITPERLWLLEAPQVFLGPYHPGLFSDLTARQIEIFLPALDGLDRIEALIDERQLIGRGRVVWPELQSLFELIARLIVGPLPIAATGPGYR